MPPAYVPADAEDITDHGAVENPTDPDAPSAQTNLDAIAAAADEAGEGGSIYVPEGEFYFGSDDRTFQIQFDSDGYQPKGISIYGDGPEKSRLAQTEHLPDDQIHIMFRYLGSGQGNVEIRGLEIDGNARNLGDLQSNSVGQTNIDFDGASASDHLDMERVHLKDSYNRGLWVRGLGCHVKWTTFWRCGLQVLIDSESSTSHCVQCRPDSSNEAIFERCKFLHTSGNAVNDNTNQNSDSIGVITIKQSYARGVGTGVVKLSGAKPFTFENVYVESWTQELEDDMPDGMDYAGRRGPFYRLDGDSSVVTEVHMDNVETVSTTREAIEVRAGHNCEITGDMITFEDCARDGDRNYVIRADHNGAELNNVNINRLSAHDNNTSSIFNTPDSDGTIDTVSHDTSGTLGDTGQITVSTEDDGGDPFEPDVPTSSEAGHDGSLPSEAGRVPRSVLGVRQTETAVVQTAEVDPS